MTTTANQKVFPLYCEGVHRSLGHGDNRVSVLQGVSFSTCRGETSAIVGPSGCGKSTLLYLLGLLDRPDQGQIWLQGASLANADDEARTAARGVHLGFVFQFHFLLLEFTALDNVMIPMRKRAHLTEEAMRERAQALLTSVGLGGKTHRLGSQLSGGEQQRVAVARALANSPAVILADEPTGNLDQRNSDLVFELLAGLARDNGQSIVMVTHNPELAKRCDRVLPMRDGAFVS